MAPVARDTKTSPTLLGGGTARVFRMVRQRRHPRAFGGSSAKTSGPRIGEAGLGPQISCGDAGFGRTISKASTVDPEELLCDGEGFIRATSASSSLAIDWECLEESPTTRVGLAEEEEEVEEAPLPDLPRIDREGAVALLSDLCSRYSGPEFQIKLMGVFCGTDQWGAAYCEQLTALFRPTRDALLAEYGFPQGAPGDVALAIALGEHNGDPDVQLMLASIEEQLYGAEAPLIEHSKMLSKQQVIAACRAQIAAFSEPSFRRKARSAEPSVRRELALVEQIPILASFGLEPNERGAHSFLNQFAQYIMHPDVAAHGTAVNALLGMGPQECQGFLERLQQTSVQHPCPRVLNPQTLRILRDAEYKKHVGAFEPVLDKDGAMMIRPSLCGRKALYLAKRGTLPRVARPAVH